MRRVLAVLVAVLAAGCSADPGQPRTLPHLTATPTPSATPTMSDQDAVAQVVRKYYTLLNADTSASQATQLLRLMDDSCSCQEVVRSIRTALRKHQHFFGNNVVESLVPTIDGPDSADVLVTYDYTRSGIADSSGRVISFGPGRIGTTQNFRLVRKGGDWLIAKILRVNAGTPR